MWALSQNLHVQNIHKYISNVSSMLTTSFTFSKFAHSRAPVAIALVHSQVNLNDIRAASEFFVKVSTKLVSTVHVVSSCAEQ